MAKSSAFRRFLKILRRFRRTWRPNRLHPMHTAIVYKPPGGIQHRFGPARKAALHLTKAGTGTAFRELHCRSLCVRYLRIRLQQPHIRQKQNAAHCNRQDKNGTPHFHRQRPFLSYLTMYLSQIQQIFSVLVYIITPKQKLFFVHYS